MTLSMKTTVGEKINGRWSFGLFLLLFSLLVLAENSARLDILPTDDEDRLTDEIYNSTTGWRKPPKYESEWRQEKQKQQGRIKFGYDAAYEEMRDRDKNYGLGTGLGGIDHPQNTQLRLSF